MSVTSPTERSEVWCCICCGTRPLQRGEGLTWYPAIQRHVDPLCLSSLMRELRESDKELGNLIWSVLHPAGQVELKPESVHCILCGQAALTGIHKANPHLIPDGHSHDLQWNSETQCYAHTSCIQFELWRSRELGLDMGALMVKLNGISRTPPHHTHRHMREGFKHNDDLNLRRIELHGNGITTG